MAPHFPVLNPQKILSSIRHAEHYWRMARARAEFANPDRLLKDKMFAAARILTRQAEGAMLVPTSALQYVGDKPFVFVKLQNDLFEARAVMLGTKFNGR